MTTVARVLLLRHPHAAWAQPGLGDFERPLDERGISDANLIARAVATRELYPDIVVCSPANRCAQTSDIIAAALPGNTDIRFVEALYHSDHDYYLQLLAQQEVATVMIIGHNPMMEDTARALTLTSEPWPAQRLQKGYPTAGLAVINIKTTDPQTSLGGHLTEFLTPKRLKKQQAQTG